MSDIRSVFVLRAKAVSALFERVTDVRSFLGFFACGVERKGSLPFPGRCNGNPNSFLFANVPFQAAQLSCWESTKRCLSQNPSLGKDTDISLHFGGPLPHRKVRGLRDEGARFQSPGIPTHLSFLAHAKASPKPAFPRSPRGCGSKPMGSHFGGR